MRGKLIEELARVCMGEGGNLIKQAGRRRKQGWYGDKLMPIPPGMDCTLSPDRDGVVGEAYSIWPETVVKEDEK